MSKISDVSKLTILTHHQVLLVASTEGLIAGGVAGLFWSYIWTYAGMTLVVLSLAEMASMAPTSGGQYHWVSEFAPPKYQKLLSYFTGWMSAMSWQAGAASGPFLVGTMIQSLVYVNRESYEATNWQGTLMVGWIYAAVILFMIANSTRYGRSHSSCTLATSTVAELCPCSRTLCSLFTSSDSLP